MRFFVLVNGKFMVKVDNHTSSGGAEHEVLDSINGVWNALAFDEEEIKSEYFRGWLLKDGTVLVDSPEDLDDIFFKFGSSKRNLEVRKNDVEELRKIKEEHQKRLAEINKAIINAEERLKDAEEDLRNVKAELNIKEV